MTRHDKMVAAIGAYCASHTEQPLELALECLTEAEIQMEEGARVNDAIASAFQGPLKTVLFRTEL